MSYGNLAGGQWVHADRFGLNRNPSTPADVIGEYAQAGVVDIETAVAAAQAAFPAWSTGACKRVVSR